MVHPVQPLRPGDPGRIGGHVLLGRLGAGGMGVVYLGRSTGGGLAAVKVIRAELAADPGFRVRFRREVEATGRLRNRWLVPVTAADPDSREPWLATAYVPGLSLAQALDIRGALPERTVRILGYHLAAALTDVHAAGLVHRDVKPGNILLGADGPRLIDFGIVRPDGVTALTASDLVIGSPGFLAPEQARARTGEVGPAADVFSLGCVLAYAVTGRRPFGAGTVAGVLYHTVHEEPDLHGVPPELLPLLRACLAKEPGRRPAADALRADLAAGQEVAGRSWDDWLPAPLPAIIAERSAEVLALPEPPEGSTRLLPLEPDGTATRPVRPRRHSRRALLFGVGAAAVAAGGVTAARLLGSGGTDGPPHGARPRCTIGVQADLSGELRVLGRSQERGARLAVAHYNARHDRPFDLRLSVRDDRGEAERAEAVARGFVADDEVAAVLGATGTAGIDEVLDLHQQALLPLVSVSSPRTGNNVRVRTTFFQLRADRLGIQRGFHDYLTAVRPSRRVFLVDDRAATGDHDWNLVETIQGFPPTGATVVVHPGPAHDDDFDPVAAAVRKDGAPAVVFVGASAHRAARCARALDRAGYDGARMAPEAVLRPVLPHDGGPARLPFLDDAGEAAEDWVCVTTYADPTRLPAAEDFVARYRTAFSDPPAVGVTAPFAVEAYDAVLLIASALRPPEQGGPERGSTTGRLRAAHHEGLAKPLAFDARTKYFKEAPGICLYQVRHGTPVFLYNVQDLEEEASP